jgi:poly(3-hydroxybutyrate) depolymerase
LKQIRRYAAVLVASTGLIPPVSGQTIPAAVSAAVRIATCPASVPTGDHRGKLVVDKLSRTYLLHIPLHIRAGHRYPLIIMLHPGYEYLAPPVPEVTHMSTVADRHGFVVVYPDGVNGQWHTDAPDDKPVQGPQNDVRFMSRLIDALGTQVCLDLQRVYASGQSSAAVTRYLRPDSANPFRRSRAQALKGSAFSHPPSRSTLSAPK